MLLIALDALKTEMTVSDQPVNRNMNSLKFKFKDEMIEPQDKIEKETRNLGEKLAPKKHHHRGTDGHC